MSTRSGQNRLRYHGDLVVQAVIRIDWAKSANSVQLGSQETGFLKTNYDELNKQMLEPKGDTDCSDPGS